VLAANIFIFNLHLDHLPKKFLTPGVDFVKPFEGVLPVTAAWIWEGGWD
jgi:hypothetical protein